MFGQVYTNKRAISSHYNADPKLFLSFLDPIFPAYSQGVYAHDDEPLDALREGRVADDGCGNVRQRRLREDGDVTVCPAQQLVDSVLRLGSLRPPP